MRKKTILYFVDTVFWWTVYALPVILLVIGNNNFSSDTVAGDILRNFFYLVADNPIVTALVGLFGDEGVLPFFSSSSYIFIILTWFVAANLCHIAVDVILFIPRMAHKFIDILTSRGADNG